MEICIQQELLKTEIYKLIISDLEKAIQFLPTKQQYGDSDKGRASKGAAIGALAKYISP